MNERISNNFRIIFITHYTLLYGANRSLLDLIDGLSLSGISDFLVLVPQQGDIVDELKKRKIPYRIIRFASEIYFEGSKFSRLKSMAAFGYNWFKVMRHGFSLKQKNKNTIIHSNSSATLCGAYFARVLNAPHVWHIREFGYDDYKYKYNFGYKYFQSWLNRSAAAIAISNAVLETRVKDCKAPIKKVVYNGIVSLRDIEEKRKNRNEILLKKNIVFGIIGFISNEKNQAEALEAFNIFHKKFSNTEMIIAGSGKDEYIEMLKQKTKEYGLENEVKFAGHLKEPEKFYGEIDCLLMCSKNEALGRVTIEAMSHGVAVIGYNNAGTAEILKHKYNGLLYKNGYHELCEMMQLFMTDSEIVKQMKANALQTVKDNFTTELCSKSVLDIYNIINNQEF